VEVTFIQSIMLLTYTLHSMLVTRLGTRCNPTSSEICK